MTNETITGMTCAVEDCSEKGRRQVCPFDGRYHYHGHIHYTNDGDYPELFGFRFRDLAETGWLYVCDRHQAYIESGLGARKATVR